VTIRRLDPPLHEFLPALEDATSDAMRERIKQLREANPMLGTRGCRLGLMYPEIYEMQVRAIVRAALAVREQAQAAGGKVHLLVGNHEVMGARVDNQAVGTNPFPGYDDLQDLDLGDERLAFLGEHAKKRGAALMSGGPYAQRFAQLALQPQVLFALGGASAA
jgi:hypothetical protein